MVKDESGNPIPGASVYVTSLFDSKTPLKATATDFDGKFRLRVSLNLNLVVSVVGFQKYNKKITTKKTDYNIVLKEEVNKIEDVVVTGIVNRDKKSFTGAAQTFTGKQLKSIGSLNVLESLKTLDPSFVFKQDGLSNAIGSDPNAIAPVRIRGGSSTSTANTLEDTFGNSTDPNQPLFILDGFEAGIKIVKDLDINRVASITILKDAASTALYGSRASNGVIVITTVAPKIGKLRVSYTQDMMLEFPDLSDYNMMNSLQKLEYERRSGYYDSSYFEGLIGIKKLSDLYNKLLAEAKRGVNTYWLSFPLREGVTMGQSLNLSGGSQAIRYTLGLNYRNLQGVMKGSERKTWGANLTLNYNKDKIRVSNNLYLSGAHPEISKYGSFSTYVNLNPYLRKTGISEGKIKKYLDEREEESKRMKNPFYDASLNSFDKQESFSLRNTTAFIWNLNNNFRVNANLFLEKSTNNRKEFKDPSSIRFDKDEFLKKGSYSDTRSESFRYSFNAMLTYALVFGQKHRITANLRGEVGSDESEGFSVNLQGFQKETNGDPKFAFGYADNGKPSTNYGISRRVNALASLNYGFDNTYFLDATYRMDGSTAFGSNTN